LGPNGFCMGPIFLICKIWALILVGYIPKSWLAMSLTLTIQEPVNLLPSGNIRTYAGAHSRTVKTSHATRAFAQAADLPSSPPPQTPGFYSLTNSSRRRSHPDSR
jgi:hypothetical protein